MNDIAVLIHGLGGTKLDMVPLKVRLKRAGFVTVSFGYLSVFRRIEPLANRLKEMLIHLENSPSTRSIHIVGHSMGAIIARAALADYQGSKIKSLLMLAPPNQGSHMARRLSPWFGWIVPTLDQLSDSPESYVNQLNQLEQFKDLNLGIIEAEKDRVIARGKVRLQRDHDYHVIIGQHGILTWYRKTGQLVEKYLATGRF